MSTRTWIKDVNKSNDMINKDFGLALECDTLHQSDWGFKSHWDIENIIYY